MELAEFREENKIWQEKPGHQDAINGGSGCLSCHGLVVLLGEGCE